MSVHTSPFGKHSAEVIANKSNKIFTFTRGDKGVVSRDTSPDQIVEQSRSERTARNETCQILRPQSRTSSFYNGYCSPCSPDMGRDTGVTTGRSHSPQHEILKRSHCPHNPSRTSSPTNSTRTPSPRNNTSPRNNSAPDSPRRHSQEDCTEENCLNLFHQHNINKSPRSNYSDWGKSSSRSLSRTPTPTRNVTSRDSVMTSRDSVMASRDSVMTSRDSVMTSRDSGVISRTPFPTKDAGLDRLSQAIRNMDNFYNVGLDGEETLTGLGESVNVTELDKVNMLLGS